METLIQDAKFAFRLLLKDPGFTAIAVIVLALGIGANTAIFSVVDGVLLSPLPYGQADRLVNVFQKSSHFTRSSVSYLNFKDWRRDNKAFVRMAAFNWNGFSLTHPGLAEHVGGKNISTGFFATLGVKLQLGREFTPQEDHEGGPPVVIISNRLWRRRFGASPHAVGEAVALDGKAYTVVGVMPRGFRMRGRADVMAPLGQIDPALLRDRRINPGIQVIARMKTGVTLAQAQADMANVQRSLDQLYPKADQGIEANVISLKEVLVGWTSRTLWMLLGAVALVLLIACANVANLLLARSSARSREFAIRSALGADRPRVVRQLLTESVLLALAGGVVGLLVAFWGTKPVVAAVPGSLPRSHDIGLNLPVLFFTFAASMIVGVLFGLAPAMKHSNVSLQETLKEGGRTASGGRQRSQRALVIFQMALTIVLLVGAGLMIESVWRLNAVNPGFRPQRVLTFSVALSPASTETPNAIRTAYRQLIGRIQNIPGVQATAVTDLVPLEGSDDDIPFWIGSQTPTAWNKAPLTLFYCTSPGYLRAMGIPLLRGRFITNDDTPKSAHVVVIDRELAHRYFHGQDPVGQTLTLALLGKVRIVGVAGHVKHWSLAGGSADLVRNEAYLSFDQIPDQFMKTVSEGVTFIVRSQLPGGALIGSVKRAVFGGGNDQPVYDVQTMNEIVSESIADRRFPMLLLGIFAVLALVLAAVGIYGVISYSTSRRTHEIGIRMALGARRGDVLKLVVRQGAMLALSGIAVGLVSAVALSRFLSKLLFGVKPTDPVIYTVVSLSLLAVALAACFIPARRAAATDPVDALRYE
jgi:predicted permease